MVAQETYVTNAAETTLSSSLAAGATTINVTSTSAFPAIPFYAVIDPDVNASREIILVDSAKTATTFTLTAASRRGQDGTTDTSHSSGAKVVCVPVAALWTDINDRVDAVAAADYKPGGTDVAVADGGTGASTAAGARTNLGAASATTVAARAHRTTNQTLANDAFTAIGFDAEAFDSDAIHDTVTNNTRFTVPVGLGGIWMLAAQIGYAASSAGRRGVAVRVNGTTYNSIALLGNGGAGVTTNVPASVILLLSAGDYIEVMGFQDSGGLLDVVLGSNTTFASFARLGA